MQNVLNFLKLTQIFSNSRFFEKQVTGPRTDGQTEKPLTELHFATKNAWSRQHVTSMKKPTFPKLEQLLEGVLNEKSGDDSHGGRQGGGANALAFQRLFIDARGDDKGRSASETRRLTW